MTKNQIDYFNAVENKRHNLENEKLGANTLQETKRHNIASESISYAQIEESRRHNIMQENINIMSINENKRSNLAKEEEAKRHNIVYEEETLRHNVAMEANNRRSLELQDEWKKDDQALKKFEVELNARGNILKTIVGAGSVITHAAS